MGYQKHFRLADDMIDHLDTVIDSIDDPFIASRYVGFVSVTAVTVYELAIKEIFYEFGEKTHKVLGTFTRNSFQRLNGRITIDDIRKEYIRKFGENYLEIFDKKTSEAEESKLKETKKSIKEYYSNIIKWRHSFAHEGIIPTTPTYHEITQSYKFGKEIIRCLAEAMQIE